MGNGVVTLDLARAMDTAGIDRLVVSDRVVFDKKLAAYADPSEGGQAGGRNPRASTARD
ncbi:hypothetical protein [Mycobacterium sp. 236(2023)]|uniref:hypothetical protein n=1 Tax=Mycobacterium sp. 236(2023) TaxID=3038163 RepID=UPI0024157779|nr:hypothetical protein [Mycobacterium sp. 236(2023)]MDG4669220.1 hypothetical protein [Mycobacterium sp. 236(2023)]